MATVAAWLWLPLFVGLCLALGFYRSFTEAGAGGAQPTLCPDGSHLSRFLDCG